MTRVVLYLLAMTAATVAQKTEDNDCVGVWFVDTGYKDGACCVGGTQTPPNLSTCDGWPICKAPATTKFSLSPLSCATVVPSNSDYSKNLAQATSSLSASGNHVHTTYTFGQATAGATASGPTATSSGPAATSSDSAATSSGSAATSSGSGSTSSSSSSSGAASVESDMNTVAAALALLVAALF